MTLDSSIWIFWMLATAYRRNIIGVSFMRALARLGGGLIVPNAVALLTTTLLLQKIAKLGVGSFCIYSADRRRWWMYYC